MNLKMKTANGNACIPAMKTLTHSVPDEESQCSSTSLADAADIAFFGSPCVRSPSTVRFSLQKRKACQDGEDAKDDVASGTKKMRRTLSRCTKSFSSLGNLATTSSTHVVSPPASPTTSTEGIGENLTNRVNSLEFQLSCVSATSKCDELPHLVFPNLPVTVSDSSCSTRGSVASSESTMPTPKRNVPAKEGASTDPGTPTYGWFVVMDDEICESKTFAAQNVYKKASHDVEDLAFSATTAPKRFSEDEEAELAWAAAADTVDDVLGDFF